MFAHNAVTAHDTGHRVDCAEALRVLGRGEHLLECDDLPLEVEHGFPLLTVVPVLGSNVGEVQLVFLLGATTIASYSLRPRPIASRPSSASPPPASPQTPFFFREFKQTFGSVEGELAATQRGESLHWSNSCRRHWAAGEPPQP